MTFLDQTYTNIGTEENPTWVVQSDSASTDIADAAPVETAAASAGTPAVVPEVKPEPEVINKPVEAVPAGSNQFKIGDSDGYLKFEDGSMEYVNIYQGGDPASTLGSRNDYSVIMVIGVTSEYDYYIIEYWRQRVLPMDCADEIFKIAERYRPIKRINIETISYQEMLRDYVQKRSKKE